MPPLEPTIAYDGFACPDCGDVDRPTVRGRCPNCEHTLSVAYDRVDGQSSTGDLATEFADQRRFAPFLPFDPDTIVSLHEGATPLVACPTLADDLGVDRVLVKDEGRNPTGSTVDRGLSLAITDAIARGRETVALATTGHGGQSAAAYAGRAGIDATAFVPTRSSHLTKAMVNVHGGDMTVVEGRYPDAEAAFDDWLADRVNEVESDLRESVVGVGPASPFRREGAKLLAHEILHQLDGHLPAAIVYPTGHGVGLAGARAALTERRNDDQREADRLDATPRLVAAQPDGCAPIVRAIDEEGYGPWERPDTIAGTLEIPDPARGREAVTAVQDTEGDAVAVPDDELLAAAVDDTAADGVELGTAGGVGVAAARKLADSFDADDTVVVVNPVAGNKESDVLRSELMGRGK